MAGFGVSVPPQLVDAWESGSHVPNETQLFALADVLWCSTNELMGIEPRTLRELRWGRQLTAERLADRIGMPLAEYEEAEEQQTWNGNYRQTSALADVLGLGLRHLVDVMGRSGELEKLLLAAIEGRWKSYVGPIAQLSSVSEMRVASTLKAMQAEYKDFSERYMGHLATRGGDSQLKQIAAERDAYLADLGGRFWERVDGQGSGTAFRR